MGFWNFRQNPICELPNNAYALSNEANQFPGVLPPKSDIYIFKYMHTQKEGGSEREGSVSVYKYEYQCEYFSDAKCMKSHISAQES